MSYTEALDQLVQAAETATGLKATRNPAEVGSLVAAEGGCVFVQFPTHVGRLLCGANLEVPVSLVAPAPADLTSVDWLLDHFDALAEFIGPRDISNGPLDVGSNTYPAVTATAQITVTTTEVP